ncbi:MAG: hypothetical protein AAGF11_52360 [Myxococcota bacterium]
MKTPTNLTFAVLAALAVSGCDAPESTELGDRTAEISVIVDGERYELEDMDELEGEPLHFFLDANAVEEGVIYAFSDSEEEAEFIAQREKDILMQEDEQLTFRAPLTNSKFYDLDYYDIMFGKLGKGDSIANLATHPDYNDNDITSVKCRSGAYTHLYEYAGFGAPSLTCRNVNIPHLNAYGWNQRASSLEVTP